jgi:CheY-like chemotaxis protein
MAPTPHIIVAEDADSLRALIARLLVRTYPAVAISAVPNGAQALAIVEQRGADLIIADHHMPLLTGIDLVRTLRAQQITTPIIIISSDHTVEGPALAAGANYFLLKPFGVPEMRGVLLRLLPA